MVRVFIDGKFVSVLKYKHAETFPVSVGPHQVMVKHGDLVRSETLDFSVPPGDRAELECGYHHDDYSVLIQTCLYLLLAVLLLSEVRLSGWLVVVMGIGIVASGLYLWKAYTTAGSCLYLRPRALLPMPSAEDVSPASATA